ncbi:TIGR01906 family membrane protein [Chloroflexota bacterium]
MRTLEIVAKWLFILCLPVLLLSTSIGWAFNSLWLYKSGFEIYNISQTTGLAKEELENVATELRNYFTSDEEYISLTAIKDNETLVLFNQREVAHLKDVKGLIWLDYWIWLGTLIYVLAYAGVSLLWWKIGRQLAWAVVGGSCIALCIIMTMWIGSTLLNFQQLFNQFHFLAFTNELWILDPTKDYLIMLFPPEFWQYAATLWAIGIVGMAVILGGVSGGYLLVTRNKAVS